MIEVRLPDGRIVELADGTAPEEIAELAGPGRIEVDMRNGSTTIFTADASAEAIMAVTGPVRLAEPESPRGVSAPANTEQPFDWRPPLVSPIQTYNPDDEDPELAAAEARLPEGVREILRRSRRPLPQASDPDPFRDNWHSSWRRPWPGMPR
jgi:hypothetical protein